MFKVTRRTLLVGTSALAAAAMMPARSFAAERKYHALLVACTKYPALPEKHWLVGPKHDAVLVREYLLNNTPAPVKFEPENVVVLGEEVEGANGPGTLAAIKAAFDDLAGRVGRDDFVYLHLSGHGTQQPQRKAGDESDGLDEMFLPSDIGPWESQEKGVPNALVDDDIRDALAKISATGAFVWVVFDCCHSGTAVRAVDVAEEVERKVEFIDLVGGNEATRKEASKLYADATSSTATRGFDEAGNRKPAFPLTQPTGAQSIVPGKVVAFYAAQTIETTPEMPLPKGSEEAQRLGLFTYTIFSKLAENPYVSYRQLGQAVLQQYSAEGRTRPTPLFEGALDAQVFGTDVQAAIMQWPIAVKGTSATISAGLLHRLSQGSRLAILPNPLSQISDAVGYLEVQSAKNLESRVRPVEYDGKPALKITDIPAGAVARLAELAVDYKLAIARPEATPGLETATALVNSVLDELATAKDRTFNVDLVAPGGSAELRLAVQRENAFPGAGPDATDQPALWFLPASGDVVAKDGSRPPLVIIHEDDRARLADAVKANLTTIFRATALSRLAAASDYRPDQVDVRFLLKHEDGADGGALEPSTVPRVSPGDEVHLAAANKSGKLVDLNVLYVGSDYSITHIYAERLAPGATLELGLLAFTDSSFGMERMIAVLTEAPPQSEVEDLSFLAQQGVPPMTRSAAAAGFADMLADIGLAPATRSVMKLGDKGGAKGAVMIFPLETVPRV